jgi:hypothetical protein
MSSTKEGKPPIAMNVKNPETKAIDEARDCEFAAHRIDRREKKKKYIHGNRDACFELLQ